MTKDFAIETVAVHGGQAPDPVTGSRAMPIYQTTAYAFHDTEHARRLFALEEPGNIYTRIGNPTVDVFEQRIAMMEGGVAAVAFASGHAALVATIMNICHAGDEVVTSSSLYGGTYNLFATTLPKYGITTRFVDPADPENFRRAITPRTRAVFGETIGNPRLDVFDIEAVASIAHEHGIPLIIDNTFASPVLCRPFDFGADLVTHSATKWLGGHGAAMGGVVVDSGRFDWNSDKFPGFTEPDPGYHGMCYASDCGRAGFATKVRVQLLRDLGACQSPFNAFLLLLGLETLPLRMRQHSENGLAVARWLAEHPAVAWVQYPGLPDHPSYDLAQKYLTGGFGGMLIFGVKGGLEAGAKFIDSVKLFSHLANVGDAKSLVIHPASTTHSQLTPEQRVAAGVGDDLIRVSIGIENLQDLTADLDQALRAATR
jgi:O-acetylhomoserine (thiol)-lyase